jgi:hypothetical protein
MYHYIVKVPSTGEVLTAKETIIDRLDYYNDSGHYLLFDGGDETEKQFVMVTAKKLTKPMTTELNDIFEAPVTATEINVKTIDRKTFKKIHAIKDLMANDNKCRGDSKTLLVTDTTERLIEKADDIIGFSEYKEFLNNLSDYIDRTSKIRAKCLYNVVLINKFGVCLDKYIELLYGLFASKRLLMEYVMITGSQYDAERNRKETKCVYFIDDEWDFEDNGEFLKASDEVRLFEKIRKSSNIYITSMTQEQYDKLSVLDCFAAAFPNKTVIEELTADEKIEYITSVADEYGFTVNKDSFVGSRYITATPVDRIEAAIRRGIMNKLTTNDDNSCCLDISDIDTKIKKIKKLCSMNWRA